MLFRSSIPIPAPNKNINTAVIKIFPDIERTKRHIINNDEDKITVFLQPIFAAVHPVKNILITEPKAICKSKSPSSALLTERLSLTKGTSIAQSPKAKPNII